MREAMICDCCNEEVKDFKDFEENHQYCIEEWVGTNRKHIYNQVVQDTEVDE